MGKIFTDPKTGRLMEKNATCPRIYWTPYMLEQLKRDFPTTKNADIAINLNMSITSVRSKAAELGLKKTREYLSSYRRECGRYVGLLKGCRSHLRHLTQIEKHERWVLMHRLYDRWRSLPKTYQQWLNEEYGIEDMKTIPLDELREKAKLLPRKKRQTLKFNQ